MDNIADKIQRLAKTLGKSAPSDPEYINYQELRKGYEKKANADIQKIQKETKKERILAIQGQADLNPKWRFDNLVADFPEWIKQKETPAKVSRIFEWLKENRYGLVSAMRSFAEVTKLKNNIVGQLDSQADEVKATINGKPGHEGYVNNGLKYVDRMRFSSANFNKNADGIG